jgi:ABC-type transport system substrate-binding protein
MARLCSSRAVRVSLASLPHPFPWPRRGSKWEKLHDPVLNPQESINSSHVNDPKMTELLYKQRITREIEQRRELFVEIQSYAADQVYYVYASAAEQLASWQPLVKNYNTNLDASYFGFLSQ